jgi:hypothetical protein
MQKTTIPFSAAPNLYACYNVIVVSARTSALDKGNSNTSLEFINRIRFFLKPFVGSINGYISALFKDKPEV